MISKIKNAENCILNIAILSVIKVERLQSNAGKNVDRGH